MSSTTTTTTSPTQRPIITLEEHFLSKAATKHPHPRNADFKAMPDLFDRFTELGPKRLQDMDQGQVTMQVISHGPGDLTAAQCRACNDQLAEAVRAHPGRFAGFAELPMDEPDEAARELRRTCGPDAGVRFVGALVDSHTESGLYYDGPAFDVLWAAAAELDVPIYLHPTWPSAQLTEAYRSPALPDAVTTSILAFGFGWHSDVAVHVLRLYAAGVFDRFPGLKIVIGHMGEMIPFMLQRIQRTSARWGRARSFREVWDSNLWLTTSGNWALDPLACILRNTKRDRIMYSVDYPFARSPDGLKWLQELEESGMVSEEELEGIRWKNAARLLKVDVGKL
ncbi:amidohydrolase 2 [Cryphonectria parasitica EP155]|uniref:Amidohydrolase 2 n=1 Tax=Cryphonectria parasitica (strain ATCC 38755 / EP155) TaxID=660469 RepID=A0A9P4YCF8_CRYP1|nr:amidohydrolase 2 [Cryphonectria parasitica EP155]KAF3770806.1 amidohydrolase 2 [Cryphonectria parasitica EP155]